MGQTPSLCSNQVTTVLLMTQPQEEGQGAGLRWENQEEGALLKDSD